MQDSSSGLRFLWRLQNIEQNENICTCAVPVGDRNLHVQSSQVCTHRVFCVAQFGQRVAEDRVQHRAKRSVPPILCRELQKPVLDGICIALVIPAKLWIGVKRTSIAEEVVEYNAVKETRSILCVWAISVKNKTHTSTYY